LHTQDAFTFHRGKKSAANGLDFGEFGHGPRI
jgi:hypothetical protein